MRNGGNPLKFHAQVVVWSGTSITFVPGPTVLCPGTSLRRRFCARLTDPVVDGGDRI